MNRKLNRTGPDAVQQTKPATVGLDVARLRPDALTEAGRIAGAFSPLRQALVLDNGRSATPNHGPVASRPARGEPRIAHPAGKEDAGPSKSRARAAHHQAVIGVRLVQKGLSAQAIAPLRRSIELDPTVATVHHDLGLTLLSVGQAKEAIPALRQALRLAPSLTNARLNLAAAFDQLGQHREALAEYEAAVQADPTVLRAQARLGQLYLTFGRRSESQAAFRAAAAATEDPARAGVFEARGLAAVQATEQAEALLRSIIAAHKRCGEAHVALGQLQAEAGRSAEAAANFEQGITLDPTLAAAWYNFAMNTKFTTRENPAIARIAASLERAPPGSPQRKSLHFALGKVFDDLQDRAAAIGHFEAANRIRGASSAFDRARLARQTDQVIASAPPGFLAQRSDLGVPDATPILIVGMPRSGTTLVEQILSSHRDVAAGGELTFWSDREHSRLTVFGAATPVSVVHRLADDYLTLLRGISADALRVTDKMPFNFAHLGVIRQVFPRATIVHCRRHPIDTCLSIFTNGFEANFDFASDRGDLVFFYRQYQRLMAHWRQVLPATGFIEVDYEDLVSDPEPITRRMVAACGLAWDDACLAPQRNTRQITTASMWQARQPIYRSSVERWRNYEPWLGALRDLMADAPDGQRQAASP